MYKKNSHKELFISSH